MFSKESFLHNFFREVFSISILKKTILNIKAYPKKLFTALGFEVLFNFLNYVGFLFIPIVALANNLNLSEIAILFWVMRIPYIINFFTAEIVEKYNKKTLILMVLLFLSFLYALLGYNENFTAIVIITFGISMWMSVMRPVISWLITDYTHKDDAGTITGSQEFVGRAWDIIWALAFGILSVIFGIKLSFLLVWITIFIISFYGLFKKFYRKA